MFVGYVRGKEKLFPGCKLDDLDWTFTMHFQVAGEIAEAYLASE